MAPYSIPDAEAASRPPVRERMALADVIEIT